jgi:hypothetical protein
MAISTGAALLGSAVLGVGSSIMGGKAQSKAAGKAASAETEANQQNIDFQKWLYEDTKIQQQPWVDVGLKALGKLQRYAGVSGIKNEPPKLIRKDAQAQATINQGIDTKNKETTSLSDRDYVNYAINEGFGRDPESGITTKKDTNYWVNKLNQMGGDRKGFVNALAESANPGDYDIGKVYTPEIDAPKKQDQNELIARQNALMYEKDF